MLPSYADNPEFSLQHVMLVGLGIEAMTFFVLDQETGKPPTERIKIWCGEGTETYMESETDEHGMAVFPRMDRPFEVRTISLHYLWLSTEVDTNSFSLTLWMTPDPNYMEAP